MKNPLRKFYVREQGKKLIYPVVFHIPTSIVTRSYKQDEVLVSYNLGSPNNIYPIFKRGDIDMMLEMGANKPRKMTASLFMGRVGERILQVRLDDYLERMKNRYPGVEYTKAEGAPKIVVGVRGNYVAVIEGHHNNIVILKPQEDFSMPLKKRHIGKPMKREVRRMLDSVGEVDGLYLLDYSDSGHVILLGEAKTGELDKSPDDIIANHIAPLHQMYQRPNSELVYCLMAAKEVIMDNEKKRTLNNKVRKLYKALKKRNISFIVIPFNESQSELEKIGEKLYRQYMEVRGPVNLKLGTALFNDYKIIVRDNEGRVVRNLDHTKRKTWKEKFSRE